MANGIPQVLIAPLRVALQSQGFPSEMVKDDGTINPAGLLAATVPMCWLAWFAGHQKIVVFLLYLLVITCTSSAARSDSRIGRSPETTISPSSAVVVSPARARVATA